MSPRPQGALAIRIRLGYQCLPGGLILRTAEIRAFPGQGPPGTIALYDRNDASGIAPVWGSGHPDLVHLAKARFAEPMGHFWALAPRAIAGVSPFPDDGLEVAFEGVWSWDTNLRGWEQCEDLSLRVLELGRATPRRVLLLAEGIASPFIIRQGAHSLDNQGVPRYDIDDAALMARRRKLEDHFGASARLILEAFFQHAL